jgi:hypothetical protein
VDNGTIEGEKYGNLSVDGSVLISEMADGDGGFMLLAVPLEYDKEVILTFKGEKLGNAAMAQIDKGCEIFSGSDKILLYNKPIFICSK